MKFTKIGPNKVQSDRGFVFWMKSPFQLHYSENNHELIVPSEMMTGNTELLASVSTIKLWKVPQGEIVNEPDKARITENIGEALKFLGVRYEFD